MSEGPPKIPTRAEVVESLRRNPENQDTLVKYLDKRQDEVSRINTPRADLELTIELAEIARDAGYTGGAHELFEKALLQAEQRDEFRDLKDLCLKELGNLGGVGLDAESVELKMKERVISAALQYKGETFIGPNHADALRALEQAYPDFLLENVRDGYITNTDRFISRDEGVALSRGKSPS